MILNNFTLLYVEDDKTTQELVKLLLKDKVKELFIASNGQEGLELYKDKNPDIVLTDINMPVMDGLDMSQKIKDINFHQPIVLLTAYSDLDFFKKSIEIGIDKYMIKPIKNKNIFYNTLEIIAKILQADIDRAKSDQMLQSQAKVAAMGEMIGNIAHQWRQPLSVISTAASGIDMYREIGTLTDENLEKLTKTIVDQTMYLSQTIDDFRDFFQDTSETKKEFNLKDTISKAIDLSNDSYKNSFIKIIYSYEDCIINENENQLSQALLNIFNNAKDAFIINNIKHDRYLFIDLQQNDDEVTISFKDNAGGIPKDIINKIFEPYFTTKHQSQGTGIGLYMTHQIITKHFKGTIEVHNTKYTYKNINYKGAEFIIKLRSVQNSMSI